MKRKNAILLLLGAALCWSLGGVLIKWVDWNPMAIAGARSSIAAVVVWAAFPRMKFTWSAYQIAGALAYAATMITFVVATRMSTAANAVLLQYTAPAWVALFSAWFLKERVRRSDWATISIVLGGIVLFFMDRLTFSGFWGNLAAIASGFSFGWVFLLFRRQKELAPYGSLFLGNVLAGVICLPWMLQDVPDPKGVLGLVLLGVVQIGLAYILYSVASRHVRAIEAALILLLEPLLNPVWTFLAIGEVPGPWAMVGGAIILGVITFQAIFRQMSEGVSLPESG
ncbi:DMT family transporter [bacterium]|nr:DMT family transporter [bacterium]